MPGLLPLILLLGLFALIGARAGIPRRDALFRAALATGVWAAIGGELLSLAHALTLWPLAAWWGAPAAGALAWVWFRRRDVAAWLRPVPRPDAWTIAFAGAAALLLLAAALVGAFTPPNNNDALGYHLPRQMYWLQNATLAHYPSWDLRQLQFPPFAESLGLQLLILGAGDRAGNLVQCVALALTALAASAITRDLSGDARRQSFSALFVVTVPAAVHQAVNAKNDLVVALWLCTLAHLLVRVRVTGACRWPDALAIAAAVGLLLYTKGTAYIIALPLCAVGGLWMLAAARARAIPMGAAVVIIAAALNTGHWSRNLQSFEHPLGLPEERKGYNLTNDTVTPAVVLSSVIRNIALHTSAPLDAVNAAQARAIAVVHEAIGLDPGDPRTTVPARTGFRVRFVPFQDGTCGAPVHLLLGLVAVGWAVATPGRRLVRPRAGLFAAVLAAALLFCILLKWQPWHARLHIPMIAAFAPLCAVWLPGGRSGQAVGALAAFALGVVTFVGNAAKPLVGPKGIFAVDREHVLFRSDERLRLAARGSVEIARAMSPGVVAVAPGTASVEYALQDMIWRTITPRPVIVAARPNYGPRPDGVDPWPDVIIAGEFTQMFMLHAQTAPRYIAVAQHWPFTVYAPAEKVDRAAIPWEEMPWIGWRPVEGLTATREPAPDPAVPLVRWGLAPQTRLRFNSPDAPALLVLEAHPNNTPNQTMDVLLNDEPVYHYDFGRPREYTTHRIPLAPINGLNFLTIRYGNGQLAPSGDEQRAVLFRKIQIIQRFGEPDPPDQAADDGQTPAPP